ncbi:MAG: UvrD-helicase domain-containing protein [bacterium]|nr:UvrD-helicase domain-containing protein [bacterium]
MFPPESPGSATDFLADLNPQQVEAVTHGGGPLLVLAGAGSGKTRVITHRIARLILDERIAPWRIVAVTFTNKAAAEMRERVERILGSTESGCRIGTFHSMCLRILRRDGERVGLASGFTIYDSDDQLAVVKRILKDEGADPDAGTPRSYRAKISRAKNALDSPDALEARAFTPDAKLVARVYRRYEETLARANAVDFDDLLLKTLRLFDEHDDVRHEYAERCEHLLVDEYQDTNRPQYRLVRHLSSVHGNICVVGDEDQSIYRFRGAEIRNILDFESDHPGARTIRLEQNYRSTGNIIEAASKLIANNVYRKGKKLWTDNEEGEKLQLFQAPDDRSEAVWVAQKATELAGGESYEDIVVLYRTNAQSRQFEEIFRRDRIPYQIVGSIQFYERKEIKDLLAYLKIAENPIDDVSFRRVLNTPPRGIGGTTLRVVENVARTTGLPLVEAGAHALDQDAISTRSAKKLREFLDFLADLGVRAAEVPVASLVEHIVEYTKYEVHLDKQYGELSSERMENVRALISAAAEHAEESDDASLQSFLDRSALVAQADEVGARPGVTLMTIHCAKGLEFPVVFLAGLEERLFPHAMATDTDEDIEEERRLCYVAMTRARQRLFLSLAAMRRFQGALLPNPPSRFLEELPDHLVDRLAPVQGFFDTRYPRDRERSYGHASSGSSAARAVRKPAQKPAIPNKPQADPGDGFPVGATVVHPKFGGGTILNREGGGKHLKLTIHFPMHGAKKILPAYTKLRVQVG